MQVIRNKHKRIDIRNCFSEVVRLFLLYIFILRQNPFLLSTIGYLNSIKIILFIKNDITCRLYTFNYCDDYFFIQTILKVLKKALKKIVQSKNKTVRSKNK